MAGPGLENDRAWLDAFRRGDRAALGRVFRLCAAEVARTLRGGVTVHTDGGPVRMGQNLPEHDVEALVQETFLRAFSPKARQAYDGVRPYGAYLAAIARNLLIDRARKQRRDARVMTVDDLEQLPQARVEDDPTWGLQEQALRGILGTLRDALPEPDRSIFRLRFEEGRTHKETAQALGITEIMVRRRDTRLRLSILDRLRSQGFLLHAKVTIGTSLLSRKAR